MNLPAAGILFVVATPIGNLGDFSPRAVQTLKSVAAICAEDTRRTRPLLQQFGIDVPRMALHDHNEDEIAAKLVARLLAGESLALVSDAGTPLISDPGYRLVRAAREAGVKVSPVPGAAALIAALSVAGLPSDRFAFEGFLPAKAGGRRDRLQAVASEPRTLVFYESSHRILDFLGDAGNYGVALFVLGLAPVWRSRTALWKGWLMLGYGVFVLGKSAWQWAVGIVPEPVIMGWVSLLALAVNVGVAALLYAHRTGDAQARSVWLCSRNDALGNIAVLAAAGGVWATAQGWPDIAVALVLAGLALTSGASVIRHARNELRAVQARD